MNEEMVMSKEVYLESMRRYIREKVETDYIMPIWLPFIPILLSLVAVILFILIAASTAMLEVKGSFEEIPTGMMITPEQHLGEIFLRGLGILVFVLALAGGIINIYVLYKWIDRRNKHFRRIRLLFVEVISYIRSLGRTSERAENYISSIERSLREAEIEESEKNPIIWIVLSILVPFLIFYVYHFLNKDFYKHERREEYIIEDLNRVLAEVGGGGLTIRRVQTVPDRSTAIYLALSILTLGIFVLYWVYTLTKDPNEHFLEHRKWEEEMLRALESLK